MREFNINSHVFLLILFTFIVSFWGVQHDTFLGQTLLLFILYYFIRRNKTQYLPNILLILYAVILIVYVYPQHVSSQTFGVYGEEVSDSLGLLVLLATFITVLSVCLVLTKTKKHIEVDFSTYSYNLRKTQTLLLVLIGLQFIYVLYNGGIGGIINNYQNKIIGQDSTQESGFLVIFLDSSPYIYMSLFLIKNRSRKITQRRFFSFMFLLLLLSLFCGGMKGSRSHTIYTLVQGTLGCLLIGYRPRVQHLMLFALVGVGLFVALTAYKVKGSVSPSLNEVEVVNNDYTGDISRVGYLAYQLDLETNTAARGWGSTYLYSLIRFVPLGKSVIKFLDLQGRSELILRREGGRSEVNSRILGFNGELFLNFGMIGLLLSPFLFLTLYQTIVRYMMRIINHPIQFTFIPFLLILPLLALISDSQNLVFLVLKRMVIPWIFISQIRFKSC